MTPLSKTQQGNAWEATPNLRPFLSRLLGEVETHTNLNRLSTTGRVTERKRIVICADGTWNTPKENGGAASPTNVWLTYQMVKDADAGGMPQLKYYHAGVGTAGDWLKRFVNGAVGGDLEWNMLDCYRFLVDHYVPGDHVYLFGFSRGAYTVRTLAGLIRNSGIIDRTKVPAEDRNRTIKDAYKLYRDRSVDATPIAPRSVQFRDQHSHPDFHLAGIGVWETVGALGIPAEKHSPIAIWNNWRYAFHDVTLSAYVDCAFHALAVDERRGPFRATLWMQQPHALAAGQVLDQTWFPGVHSDVGGGYAWPNRGLANATLRWMATRFDTHCRLELDMGVLGAIEKHTQAQTVIHDSTTAPYKAMNLLRITKPFERVIDSSLAGNGARDYDRVTTEVLTDTEALKPAYDRRVRVWPPSNVQDYRGRVDAERRRNPKPSQPAAGLDRKPVS